MAGEWEQTRLGNYIALKGGLSYRGEFVDKGDALLISMGCVSHTERFLFQGCRRYGGDFTKAHLVEPGDLVIATRQQSDNLPILGFPAMIPNGLKGREVIVATNLYKVANHSSISNRFLYWLLRGREYRERILECSKGTTVRMLTKDAIEDFHFLCPPATERDAIVGILDSLDDKIELNRRMNETLEGIARAIFKSWFMDFDPVRAKSEGRDTGLPKHIADLFPDSFVDSELGEIPKGWECKTVGDLAEVVGGSTPSTKEPTYWDNGAHHWATPKDLSALKMPVLLNTERRITDAGLAQISSGLLPMGTVLMSSRAPIGYLAVAEVPVAINQGFIAMKPKKGVSNLFLLLWTRFAHDDILSRANGSTFLEISKANFRPIGLVEPSPKVMQAFDQLAQPFYRRIVESESESCSLAALRDTLLPKLVSGELRIKDAEKFLEKRL